MIISKISIYYGRSNFIRLCNWFSMGLPNLQMTDEEIEDWLDSMGHYLPNCEWMAGQHIYINDERF